MTQLVWGDLGQRFYEAGADRGVLFVGEDPGVAWSGIVAVDEAPTGGDISGFYLDGVRYLNVAASEEYSATLSAYSSPAEFAVCDGTSMIAMGLFATQQARKKFALTYRTKIGNDVDGIDHAYKIHIVYNALAKPTSRSNETVSDSISPLGLTWAISTVPVDVPGAKPTSHLVLDSRLVDPGDLQAIEDLLYGTSGTDSSLPTPEELIFMLS